MKKARQGFKPAITAMAVAGGRKGLRVAAGCLCRGKFSGSARVKGCCRRIDEETLEV